MVIKMFNGWYFFWVLLAAGAIVGLYFLLRKANPKVQKAVLFSLLALGLLLHFLKIFIPPYSVDEAKRLSESWFVNICGANIGLFPFFFFVKNKYVKDYMFYLGVLGGFLAILYPIEPLEKADQIAEFWDIIRFYYHHWMLFAVPLLMILFKHHELSYKRVFSAPTGLLLLFLFIMINQILQSELGFIPLRENDMFNINYRNNSYIWGPKKNDAIGTFFSWFCPDFFKTIPVGPYAGQEKYWPWFWMIFPCFILVTPLAFGICMIFDHKNFAKDVKWLWKKLGTIVKNLKDGKSIREAVTLDAETEVSAEAAIAVDNEEGI